MHYFLQGLTMGMAYVAPIGLQNMFVINGALTFSRRRAMLNALFVIFFDITLSCSCFFGIGALMQHYPFLQMAVLLIGSLIVMYIGISLLRAKPEPISERKSDSSTRKMFGSAFVVTWCNPQAIIDGTMLLGAFQVTLPASQSLPFLSGVLSASFIWFPVLTLGISLFRSHFQTGVLRKINLICGSIVVLYGAKLFYSFLRLCF